MPEKKIICKRIVNLFRYYFVELQPYICSNVLVQSYTHYQILNKGGGPRTRFGNVCNFVLERTSLNISFWINRCTSERTWYQVIAWVDYCLFHLLILHTRTICSKRMIWNFYVSINRLIWIKLLLRLCRLVQSKNMAFDRHLQSSTT